MALNGYGGYSAAMNVNSNASITYSGVNSIKLNGAASNSGQANLTIDNTGHRRGMGKDFELQAQQPDGSWKTIHSGKVYGMIYAKRFAPVNARQVRLNISAPVSQFDLFPAGK